MPLINVQLIENVFTPEQKRQIITKLTDAMLSVEGEALRGATWVTLNEVKEGSWGMGGKALTAGDVHRMQKGAS